MKISKILKKLKINLCLVFGTSLISKEIFTIPTQGCLNIHTGLVQGFRELIVVIGQYLKKTRVHCNNPPN